MKSRSLAVTLFAIGRGWRLLWALFGMGVILLAAAPARADTIFDLTGTFTDNTTVSGTLTIDVTTGVVDAANLLYGGATYSTVQQQFTFTGLTAGGQTPVPVDYLVEIGTSASVLPGLHFLLGNSAVTLVSYAGGALCSDTVPCGPDQEGFFYASTFFSVSDLGVTLQAGELSAVPGPVVGAGLPGLILASGSLLGWWRRKRKAEAAA